MKTLKDLEQMDYQVGEKMVWSDDLKKLVIEHIKEFSGEGLVFSNGFPPTDKHSIIFNNVNDKAIFLWVKYFFNITEKELEE
jgi:hypothetical protein